MKITAEDTLKEIALKTGVKINPAWFENNTEGFEKKKVEEVINFFLENRKNIKDKPIWLVLAMTKGLKEALQINTFLFEIPEGQILDEVEKEKK